MSGGICWYCYWGWAKPVADIFDRAVADLGGYENPMLYGPAHIVWADENFETGNIQWCLDHFDEYTGDYEEEHLKIVKRSLLEMLELPEEVRCIEPEDYDDTHPENFPPSMGVVKR